MSKVEDLAKEFLKKLVSHTTLYKDTIDELEVYEPDDVIWAYKEGYHQAEKDLELTWKDFEIIHKITYDTSREVGLNHGGEMSIPKFYKEVLKRFKERKQQ